MQFNKIEWYEVKKKVEIKYLYTVKTILETGSFQNAARRLNYTQSTITFQIRQLEQELSVRLFEKVGRKMALTQAGKELLPYIDAALQAVEQLMDAGKTADEMSGTINIAVPETLLIYKMQPVLQEFRLQAPNVRLSLQTLNCYEIRNSIVSGSTDIGIHYDIGSCPAPMITERLAAYPLSLVSSPLLEDGERNFIEKNQRKKVCLISNDPGSIYRNIFERYLKQKNIQLEGFMEIWSVEAAKRSVASNLGIAYLPRFAVEQELDSGLLQELPAQMENERISAAISRHKNKWISPAMELFIRLLREKLAES